MKSTNPELLSEAERDELTDIIQTAINWAARDNAKGQFVSQFVRERRIFIHPETRELDQYDCQYNQGCTGGLEEKGYAFLCSIEQFDVAPLEDGASAIETPEVGPDPTGEILEDALKSAEYNLREEILQSHIRDWNRANPGDRI